MKHPIGKPIHPKAPLLLLVEKKIRKKECAK